MRWNPPKHAQPYRPWALVTAGPDRLRAVCETGELIEADRPETVRAGWDALADHAVYARSPWRNIAASTDAREWHVYTWRRNKITSLQRHATNLRVFPVAWALPDGEADAAETVGEWVDWLRSHGVQPSAPSTAGQRLWTNTLHAPLTVRGPRGVDPSPAVFGGRMHAPSVGQHTACRYHDLAAAYPTALADTPVATVWTDSTRLDLDRSDGFAIVRVRLPDDGSPWGSLPVRTETGECDWPADGRTVDGMWTLDDLRVAVDAGATIETVQRAYYARATRHVWAEWWDRVGEARRLYNPLAKVTTNRLWGIFAMQPARGKIVCEDRWGNRMRHEAINDPEAETPEAMRTQAFLAAITSAKVRARLWWEAIRGGDVFYCDTDAVVTSDATTEVPPAGGAPGRWRLKRTMARFDVAGPQAIRWRDYGPGSEWQYSVSGVPETQAPRMFDNLDRNGGTVLYGATRGRQAPALDEPAAA